MKLSIHEPDGVETREVEQVWLGLKPYALIEVAESTEHPGEPALFLSTGGGAEDQPLYLPLLIIGEHPPEGNPVAEMLKTLASRDPSLRPGVEAVAREFNPDWLPFVLGAKAAE